MRIQNCEGLVSAVALVAALVAPARAADVFLNPKATYLHVCNDAALNAPALLLSDLGVAPGETIVIEVFGDWDNGPNPDTSVSTFAENQDGIITDGSVGGSFGAVTPRIFGIGRIAMNASFSNRYRNYLNARTFIGGEDRLRGYPTAFFAGKDMPFKLA